MRMVSPLTTCRCGTALTCSAWSLGTCMIRSAPDDSISAICVWRSGMKRISIFWMRALPLGEAAK